MLHKLRLRAFAVIVGLILAVVGVISIVSAPAWPIVAGAFAIAAVAVNTVASRLTKTVCIGCGTNLVDQPLGQYGVVCPRCGTISAPADAIPRLAGAVSDDDDADTDLDEKASEDRPANA